MAKSNLQSLLMVVGLLSSAAASSGGLSGKWTLSVEDSMHHAVTTLTVEFTDEKAESCMGGDWKVLKVVSATTKDNTFFPASDALSYRVENKQLTMGRNAWCDDYLLLQGVLGGASLRGNYFGWGPGGTTPLGYFELSQAK